MSDTNYRNSRFERKQNDLYPTPDCYVDWLIASEELNNQDKTVMIWEPACGPEEKMANRLKHHGFYVETSDIISGHDFINHPDKYPKIAKNIVTNPPYDRAICQKFVQKAIDISHKCCMLLSSDWDFAGTRAHMFTTESKFQCKVVINQRVKWIEGSSKNGMHNYAWYIWSNSAIGSKPYIKYQPHTR